MPESNDWAQWSKHVLLELERLDSEQMKIKGCIQTMKTAIAVLQVKAGMWGAIAGAVVVTAFILQEMFRG